MPSRILIGAALIASVLGNAPTCQSSKDCPTMHICDVLRFENGLAAESECKLWMGPGPAIPQEMQDRRQKICGLNVACNTDRDCGETCRCGSTRTDEQGRLTDPRCVPSFFGTHHDVNRTEAAKRFPNAHCRAERDCPELHLCDVTRFEDGVPAESECVRWFGTGPVIPDGVLKKRQAVCGVDVACNTDDDCAETCTCSSTRTAEDGLLTEPRCLPLFMGPDHHSGNRTQA